jgi:hypothetical protein
MRTVMALVASALGVVLASAGQAATLHGIGVAETLDGPDLVTAQPLPPGVPLVVHLAIDPAAFGGAGSVAALNRLDMRLARYRARNLPVVLALGQFPASDDGVAAWLGWVRTVAEHGRGRVVAYQVGDVPDGPTPEAARYAFLLRSAAVQIRSIDGDALVAQGWIPATASAWLGRLYAAGTAPYVDAVAIAAPGGADGIAARAAVDGMAALVAREASTASVLLGPVRLPGQASAAADQAVSSALRGLGTKVGTTVFTGSDASIRQALAAVARLGDLLSGDLLTLDPKAIKLSRGGTDVTAEVAHRLLYSPSRSDTFLVFWSAAAAPALDVDADISMTTPTLRDPIAGSAVPLSATRTAPNQPARLTVPGSAHPLVLDFDFGQAAISTAVETRQSVLPPVGEIVARSQQVQAAQNAALRNYTAHQQIALHFHPSPADPAWNVVTENRVFADATGVEWEQLSFSVNGAKWSSNPPAFPLLQPEKVLSLPLDLRLNQDYRYRLDGVETVDGRDAYVVRFDPVDQTRALYRGTVWIDRRTFVRLKEHAVETHSSGVVASNEEEQVFAAVGAVNGQSIWLATRLLSRQTILVAGSALLNEREIAVTDVRLNVPDFDAARTEARASDHVMLRDTDRGVRYFVKKGNTRVVSDTLTKSTRALALGADIDPSFDYPLPIAGLDVLDFDFLNRDLQLALLFGGVLALGNVQRAGLAGGHLDACVDFFGLALKANDSVFDAAG